MMELVSLGCQETQWEGPGRPVPGSGLFGQVARDTPPPQRVTFQLSPNCDSKSWQERVVGRGTECRSLNICCGLSLNSKDHESASRRQWDQGGTGAASLGLGGHG